MRAPAIAALVLASVLAACSAAPEPPPPTPRNDVVLEVYDLRDLFQGGEGRSPVFTGPEAADAWAHRALDHSCWSEGIPETEWKAPGTLVVKAVPEAHKRLAAALGEIREAAGGR